KAPREFKSAPKITPNLIPYLLNNFIEGINKIGHGANVIHKHAEENVSKEKPNKINQRYDDENLALLLKADGNKGLTASIVSSSLVILKSLSSIDIIGEDIIIITS
ncbi:13982_t:CDS:2, partial [Racocetra persica]